MALEVGKIFFEEKYVIAYSTLGIGRLIYQLPIPMCKMFIKEIFGGQSIDDFDEENFTILPGFKHLGVFFKPNGNTALALDKQRKILKLFKKAFAKCKKRLAKATKLETKAKILCKAATRVLENNFSSVGLIDYYLKHTNDIKQLQLLDRYLAEEVLAIATGNGHKKGNFAKLSFKQLRELGLPSLQHRRQLILHHHIDGSFLRWKKAQQG
jgi:hypothetical protein